MIKEFVESWDKHKDELKEYFKNNTQGNYSYYEDIVKLLFEKVINADLEDDYDKFDVEKIKIIDDGDYQGTRIFILHKNSYQPGILEYVYTHAYYGSCSGCDTLLAILDYNYDEKPNEQQVEDLMQLALHLLQRCKYMEEE
jgi:mRNA-degrading endonuclease HigB of HigAB toxin-antitoxin module